MLYLCPAPSLNVLLKDSSICSGLKNDLDVQIKHGSETTGFSNFAPHPLRDSTELHSSLTAVGWFISFSAETKAALSTRGVRRALHTSREKFSPPGASNNSYSPLAESRSVKILTATASAGTTEPKTAWASWVFARLWSRWMGVFILASSPNVLSRMMKARLDWHSGKRGIKTWNGGTETERTACIPP